MTVIGLTGNIAAGKSTVLRVFKRLGARTIDADLLARRAVAPGAPAWRAIRERWGKNVFYKNVRLDRKALARAVFGNPRELAALNAIVHPEVLREEKRLIEEFKKRDKNCVVAVDAALMVESGSHRWKDVLVVVTADDAERLKRLLKAGYKKKDALLRMKSQMPQEEKARRADYVIDNSGPISETRGAAEALYRKITAGAKKR